MKQDNTTLPLSLTSQCNENKCGHNLENGFSFKQEKNIRNLKYYKSITVSPISINYPHNNAIIWARKLDFALGIALSLTFC